MGSITMKIWVVTVVFGSVCNVQADLPTARFYDDGIIQDGDGYLQAYSYNQAKVDMLGGFVQGGFWVRDSSTLNMYGGSIGYMLDVRDTSTANIFAGTIMYGLTSEESSLVNVFGGTLGYMNGYGSPTINVSGGGILDDVAVQSDFDGEINIYGYDFFYDPDGGNWNGGQLTGVWENSKPFSMDFRNVGGKTTYDYVVLHVIPEPVTILLLGLGLVVVRKRR
jgi:hypothetical protein